jgi:hypothetical protein
MTEWVDPGDDPRVATARQALINAVISCIDAREFGSLKDRRMRREFDPSWKHMRECVIEYTHALRDSGTVPEDTISAVKDALIAAVPNLPPHNAIRSSAVGWCVAAYFGKGG